MFNLRNALCAGVVALAGAGTLSAEEAGTENTLYLLAPPTIDNVLQISQSPAAGHTARVTVGTDAADRPALAFGRISQTGSGQSLTMSVLGSNHIADISQGGRAHRAFVRIAGQSNSVSLHQTGNSHYASITQSGARNTATIRQGS